MQNKLLCSFFLSQELKMAYLFNYLNEVPFFPVFCDFLLENKLISVRKLAGRVTIIS